MATTNTPLKDTAASYDTTCRPAKRARRIQNPSRDLTRTSPSDGSSPTGRNTMAPPTAIPTAIPNHSTFNLAIRPGPRRSLRIQRRLRNAPYLPNELWYMICSLIDDPEDLTNFRCACRPFTNYGLPAALREVTIYAHGYHLDKLKDLANDPIRAKFVKSIVLVPYSVATTGERVSQSRFQRIRNEFQHYPRNPLRKFCSAAPDQRGISSRVDGQDLSAVLAEVLPMFPGFQSFTFRPLTGLLHTLKYYPKACETVSKTKPFHWDLDTSTYLSWTRDWNDSHALQTCVESRDYLLDRVKYRRVPFQLTALQACAKQLGSLTIAQISSKSIAKIAALCENSVLSRLREIKIEICLGVKGEYDHAEERTEILKGDLRDFLTKMPNIQSISIHFTVQLPDAFMARCVGEPDAMPVASFGDIFEPGHRWPSLEQISIAGIVVDESWRSFINLHRQTLKGIELFSFFLSSEYRSPNVEVDNHDDDGQDIDHDLIPNFFADMQECMAGIERLVIYGRIRHPLESTVDAMEAPRHWDLGTPWEENELREELSGYLMHGGEHPLRRRLGKDLPSS